MRWASRDEIESPMPAPGTRRLGSCTRRNGSKIARCAVDGMPMPVSATTSATDPSGVARRSALSSHAP